MNKNNAAEDINKYAEDIKTIKDTLLKIDEKPFFEIWAWYLNGAFILFGTLAHFLLSYFLKWPLDKILYFIWLPEMCVLVCIEVIAVFKKLSSESMPIFSRTIVKLYISVAGAAAGSIVIVYFIVQTGATNILPPVVLALFGIGYFIYAQISYNFLMIHSYFYILSAIPIYLSGLDLNHQFLTIGVIIGLSTIILGFQSWKKENKINE